MSNMIYVYTDRKQCFYSTTVHSLLHRVGVKSESGSESRSNKGDLGKVSLHRVSSEDRCTGLTHLVSIPSDRKLKKDKKISV